ncbi:MAG: glycoside hydrolase family 3 protein [Bacteroidota bacterium]
MKLRPLIVVFIVVLTGCIASNSKPTTPPYESEKISLDEMVGQMLIAGFRGTTISTHSHILKDIKRYHLGGVVLYEYDVPTKSRPRNIESSVQLKKLVNTLQDASAVPMIIAIDEEGGKVTRLKSRYGFPKGKSAQYLGELNDSDSTTYWSEVNAKKLAENGINFNFAPVVDVNIDPLSPAIGKIERSFSADPDSVTFHASLVVEAHRKHNVLTSLKHFPGHGSASADSHLGFTDVTDTWQEKELKPFRQLIGSGHVDAIMTAHVFHSKLDSLYPATLSKNILTGILREQLDWDGVIISDDMQMGAIADHFGLEVALEKCINAGADMLIFSNNIPGKYDVEIIPKAFETIKALVESGKISEKRIQEAYQRIMTLKEKLK